MLQLVLASPSQKVVETGFNQKYYVATSSVVRRSWVTFAAAPSLRHLTSSGHTDWTHLGRLVSVLFPHRSTDVAKDSEGNLRQRLVQLSSQGQLAGQFFREGSSGRDLTRSEGYCSCLTLLRGAQSLTPALLAPCLRFGGPHVDFVCLLCMRIPLSSCRE